MNKLLTAMKKDERAAPGAYYKLMKTLPRKTDRAKVRAIIKQERKHLKIISKFKGGYK